MKKKPKSKKSKPRRPNYYTLTDLIGDAKLYAKKYPNAGVFGTVHGAMPRALTVAFDVRTHDCGIEGKPSFIIEMLNPEPIPDYETKIAKQVVELVKTMRGG